jgi:hypothetical protein
MYYKKWCRKNGANPSKEMCDMFELIFRSEFPSARNHTTEGDNLRASADELLQCPWLQSGVATDQEWAEELVKRNAPKVASGLANSPRHSALFAQQAEFYACLVGAYYKQRYKTKVGDQMVVRFLDYMGLERVIDALLEEDEKDTATIEETFDDEDTMSELDLTPGEQLFVARALSVAGMKFKWISKVLG